MKAGGSSNTIAAGGSDILKAWQIDEGMRRVRFQAGYNQALHRIENGNGPWGFSLCLNIGGPPPTSEITK